MNRAFPVWFIAGLLTAGCAAPVRDQAPADAESASTRPAPASIEPAPASTRPAPLNSPAVVELSTQAREALADSRHDDAVQLLERAIRIEPRNGALWHELARVRFQQGHYEQARQLATRSNALLTGSSTLKTRNDELIDSARDAESY